MWNPKNWLIIGLIVVILSLGVVAGTRHMKVLSLETKIAELEGEVIILKKDVANRDSVIASLRQHIDAVRTADEEMQKAEAKKSVIKGKLKKADDAATVSAAPCPEGGKLGEPYAIIAADITDMFNRSRVRGTVSRDSQGADKVLPPAPKADADRPADSK